MPITDVTVKKIDHSDPTYPDPIKDRPFTDVYLLTCTFADGSKQECPCFVWDDAFCATAQRTAQMMRAFAREIDAMDKSKAAA